jgi:cysteine desulfurase/selenocysteine lyase
VKGGFDVKRRREDFPILQQTLPHGRPLVYLDNAATTQKPRAVIDALVRYYERDNANVHRGVHQLSQRATAAFEEARTRVQHFLGAAHPSEIIFTRGTTEAINLVAQSWGRANLGAGDEVLISAMEHHSNIVPWQMLCEEKGARLRVWPIDDRGELMMEALPRLLGPRTKLLALAHVSNALGTLNPLREIIERAHGQGVLVLIDGAQAVAHARVDVRDLGCDFYCFSGHKLFGPTGIGVLFGRRELLEAMAPWQGGGEMIASVTFEKTTYNVLPHKFEAGTPDIGGAIALGAAIDYVEAVGLDAIAAYEEELLRYGTQALQGVQRVRLIGTARKKASVLSFVMEGVHPHDVGTVLDQEGIAIRTGHHCAQPVMDRFGVVATARASLAFYNTREEIDALVAGLGKVAEVFA